MSLLATSAYPFQPFGFITVATAGTPVQISSVSLKVRGLIVGGFKAKGTANTAAKNVYIQDQQGNVLFVVPTGTVFAVPLSNPQLATMIDLSNLYVDADTSGDGLQVTALI